MKILRASLARICRAIEVHTGLHAREARSTVLGQRDELTVDLVWLLDAKENLISSFENDTDDASMLASLAKSYCSCCTGMKASPAWRLISSPEATERMEREGVRKATLSTYVADPPVTGDAPFIRSQLQGLAINNLADQFIEDGELDAEMQKIPELRDLDITADQLVGVATAILLVLAVWALVAIVLAERSKLQCIRPQALDILRTFR